MNRRAPNNCATSKRRCVPSVWARNHQACAPLESCWNWRKARPWLGPDGGRVAQLLYKIDRYLLAIVAHHEPQHIARLDGNEFGKPIENLRPMAGRIPVGRGTVFVAVLFVELEPDPLRDARADACACRPDFKRPASHRIGGALQLETQNLEIVRQHL